MRVRKCSSRSCDNVPDRMSWKIPEPSGELHIIDSGCLTVISSDRSELEEFLVIYVLVLSASRFILKNSCSLDSLRIVEPQESVDTLDTTRYPSHAMRLLSGA